MITVTNRDELKTSDSETVLFEGTHHRSDVTFFWVDAPPGGGPPAHWHPYAETWAVIDGPAEIVADGETMTAATGDIVTVTAETVHRFRNIGATNLKMVCMHGSPELIEYTVDED